jgi:hypothetical protein
MGSLIQPSQGRTVSKSVPELQAHDLLFINILHPRSNIHSIPDLQVLCLACHTSVGKQLRAQSRAPSSSLSARACESCFAERIVNQG